MGLDNSSLRWTVDNHIDCSDCDKTEEMIDCDHRMDALRYALATVNQKTIERTEEKMRSEDKGIVVPNPWILDYPDGNVTIAYCECRHELDRSWEYCPYCGKKIDWKTFEERDENDW